MTAPTDAWRDRQGDVWTLGTDGLMHTPETAPFHREYVEEKWGPLVPVLAPGGAVLHRPADVAGLCHWIQNRDNVQHHQTHPEFHFGHTCPYAAVAAILAGEPDPRDDAEFQGHEFYLAPEPLAARVRALADEWEKDVSDAGLSATVATFYSLHAGRLRALLRDPSTVSVQAERGLAEQLRGLARDSHARAVLSKAFRDAPMANAAEALHALADGLDSGTILLPTDEAGVES
jgi:hypothetical protein